MCIGSRFPARGGYAEAGRRPAIVGQGRAALLVSRQSSLCRSPHSKVFSDFVALYSSKTDTQNGLRRASLARKKIGVRLERLCRR